MQSVDLEVGDPQRSDRWDGWIRLRRHAISIDGPSANLITEPSFPVRWP
jgi:hypothetical protein